MTEQQQETFREVVEPVIKWLNENTNPHAIIVVENDNAVLYSGEHSVVTDEYITD